MKSKIASLVLSASVLCTALSCGAVTAFAEEPSLPQTPGSQLTASNYVVSQNTTITGTPGQSALIVKAENVVITIKSGCTLTVTGGNASKQTGGGAGIELTSGKTLTICGEGTLNATGGNAANGEAGQNGGDASTESSGKGGNGGNGGGGGGAGIGSKGGNGGYGGNGGGSVPMSNKISITGKNGSNGGNGAGSCDAGILKIKGNVKVNAHKGTVGNNPAQESKCGKSEKNIGAVVHYFLGGGAAGGNGSDGTEGANIGSGGAGGAGGGGGGSGGIYFSYFKDKPYYLNGGGGGAAVADASIKNTVFGGKANTECGNCEVTATSGRDYSAHSGGTGGTGAKEDDVSGGAGGNGGFPGASGKPSKVYTTTLINSVTQPDGERESAGYYAYPYSECQIRLTEGKDSFPYTGNPIKPKIQIVHIPTGNTLDQSAMDINIQYSNNADVGKGKIKVTGSAVNKNRISITDDSQTNPYNGDDLCLEFTITDSGIGSMLAGGNVWVIIALAVVIVACGTAMVVVKKKKKRT